MHLLETRDFLVALDRRGTVLYGCGWWANRKLEYLPPEVGNFSACVR